MDKEEIKNQAKRILDKFTNALEKVKIEESRVERKEDRRKEFEGEEETNSEFRKIMFENAPKKKEDFIIGEKGKWIK